MAKVTIQDYMKLKGLTQRDIARALGISDMAVSSMVRSDREIYLELGPDGNLSAWEKRRIPARARAE